MNKTRLIEKHCLCCGGLLEKKTLKETEPPRLKCDQCGHVHYLDPKIAACAIIELNSRIALLKRAISPGYGKWVIPGGFVDRGEVVAQAMVREVLEETGLVVKEDRLLGLYSYPDETTVVAVYKAILIRGDLAPLDETLEAGWFKKEEIPWPNLAFQSTIDSLTDYFDRIKNA